MSYSSLSDDPPLLDNYRLREANKICDFLLNRALMPEAVTVNQLQHAHSAALSSKMARILIPSTLCCGSKEDWTFTNQVNSCDQSRRPRNREEPCGGVISRSFLSSCRDPQAGLFVIARTKWCSIILRRSPLCQRRRISSTSCCPRRRGKHLLV